MQLVKIGNFAAATCSCLLCLDSAVAQNWTQTSAPSNYWAAVASSADGSKLVAASAVPGTNPAGSIWTSFDFGANWSSNNIPPYAWQSVASSSDGTRLIAASSRNNVSLVGAIYTSTNSGVTWVSNDVPSVSWYSVACSSDGWKLAASALSGGSRCFVYSSTDAGATWVSNSIFGGNFPLIAFSADGTRLFATAQASATQIIYTSTNSGVTWQSTNFFTHSPFSPWHSFAVSADGTKLAAAMYDGYVMRSSNSGTTWQIVPLPDRPWSSIASSADGTRLVAAAASPYDNSSSIYTSADSGVTWISNNAPAVRWNSVASSADGSQFVGSAGYLAPAGIYMSQTIPTPVLNVEPTGNSLVLSWIVPSTNFSLQQSHDLTMAGWVDVTNAPVLNLTNLQYEVTLPLTSGNTFYRLATP